jgi:transposase-like protein
MPRSSESWIETRRSIVEALEAGRITGSEVMAELGVSSGTLGGWVRAERVRRERTPGPFVAVEVPRVSGSGRALRLSLVGGRQLRIPEGFPAQEVVALVRALEASC